MGKPKKNYRLYAIFHSYLHLLNLRKNIQFTSANKASVPSFSFGIKDLKNK